VTGGATCAIPGRDHGAVVGLPAATLAAYREPLARGRPPLLFVRVPRVLVVGPEAIEWSSPPGGVAESTVR
jgi:hypothetical protein